MTRSEKVDFTSLMRVSPDKAYDAMTTAEAWMGGSQMERRSRRSLMVESIFSGRITVQTDTPARMANVRQSGSASLTSSKKVDCF
jgi:hypothetical protein